MIERIKKLLALSESSNENEAKLAMLKTQEILAKHKLSLKEVKEFKEANSKITTKVADNFGCYLYFKTRKTHKIVFLGRDEDVIVCNIMLEYALDSIEGTMKAIKYSYRKKGLSIKGITNDYSMGFIEGLSNRFEEQKKNNKEWGLILIKDAEVTEAYNNINFGDSINTNVDFNYSELYKQGVEDGEKFNISDKVEQGKSDEIILLKCWLLRNVK